MLNPGDNVLMKLDNEKQWTAPPTSQEQVSVEVSEDSGTGTNNATVAGTAVTLTQGTTTVTFSAE